jgi:dTDP-4-amino-4,6-dideoxy-D-galactose acyltransferase
VKASQQPESICTYLDWDSNFFACRIARANRTRLDITGLNELLDWCAVNRIDCLYFLADPDDPQTVRLAERNQFQLTDIRVTLERPLSEVSLVPSGAVARLARDEDINSLRLIAKKGHRDTRFYFDSHFDEAKCDLLYETWIEKSVQGFANAVLVAEVDRNPAGYITAHLREDGAQIGLLGVAEGHRGAGIGSNLVQQFLSWAAGAGAKKAFVVTQGRNIRAQRLYQRCGFVTASAQLWYHRWFGR